MKRLILMACIAGMMATVGLNAQKVYIDNDGRVILDMTVETGMPEGAVTNESKTILYNSISVNNTEITKINNIDNDQNHPLNTTVYQKLEISKLDPDEKTWAEAFKYCNDLDGTSDWRLPTQRELMMMYIFKPALNYLLVTDFSTTFYWSSTENSKKHSWEVNFDINKGNTYNEYKTTSNRVRCVREITP